MARKGNPFYSEDFSLNLANAHTLATLVMKRLESEQPNASRESMNGAGMLADMLEKMSEEYEKTAYVED